MMCYAVDGQSYELLHLDSNSVIDPSYSLITIAC